MTDDEWYDAQMRAMAAAWPPNETDDDIRWMPICAIECSLCGQRSTEAMHLCTTTATDYNCINLCRPCLTRINATLPSPSNDVH